MDRSLNQPISEMKKDIIGDYYSWELNNQYYWPGKPVRLFCIGVAFHPTGGVVLSSQT